MIKYEGLPEDYFETYSQKIEEVSANDIQNVAV